MFNKVALPFPLLSRVLRAYRAAKKAAKKAQETYLDAKEDVDKKHACLLSFSEVVIASKADIKTVIHLKQTNRTWQVKVELPKKYKPNCRNKPSVKRLLAMASKAQIPFVSKKVWA